MNGVTRQDYTFQTVLGSMGLNHMNGRIEDSVTGIFLSADPVVGNPFLTSEYNRYSYVDNNPLAMVDPSGFDACAADDKVVIPCANGNSQNGDSLPEVTVEGSRPDSTGDMGPDVGPFPYSGGPGAGLDEIIVTGHKGHSPNPSHLTPSQLLDDIVVTALRQPQIPAPARPLTPKPCYAARGNNPNVLRNIGIGAEVGAIGIGAFAAINIVGFPEVEVFEGVGGLLAAVSALGDAPLVALSYGTYGATAFGIAGFAVTPSQCVGQ